MEKIGVTIVGAGIIGLSVAEELGSIEGSVLIIEKNESFGTESSSRNSEVIHSGIYYPTGSLRHRLCIDGNELLYELCESNDIDFKKTGKLIIATEDDELDDLHALFANGNKNSVPGLKIISSSEAQSYEPCVRCREAIFVPTTGIIDSHGLMEYFLGVAKGNGAEIIYNTEVIKIEKKGGSGYNLTVKESDGIEFSFKSEVVINCAGLDSDTVARMAGIDVEKEGYDLKYCKGSYFRIQNPGRLGISHLIYPVVKKDSVSLGIHVAIDLTGDIRLGPDVEYLTERVQDYNVPEEKKEEFYNSVKKFLPDISLDDLYPDTAGIRSKLQGADEGFRDFIIKEEKDRGLEGFINLIGIDSPGLTAAPAIGKMVKGMV